MVRGPNWCADVFSLFVFGNDGVECDPSDSVIRSGAVVKAQVHRDCPSLRRNTANLQLRGGRWNE